MPTEKTEVAKEAELDDEPMDFGKKKKKKKKKGFNLEAYEADQETEVAASGGDTRAADSSKPAELAAVDDRVIDYAAIDIDFILPAKKKRKRKPVPEEFAEDFDAQVDVEGAAEETVADTSAWAGSDRDYLYTELLERVFDIMRAKNPNMVQGEKRRFVMKPPMVIRLGSKKSGFVNFIEISKMMHRSPDHVLGYLLAELGTSGTLDGNQVLVLKGRFQQKQMESVLRRYIRTFSAPVLPASSYPVSLLLSGRLAHICPRPPFQDQMGCRGGRVILNEI